MAIIVTVGVDLAKNVFVVHGVDATGTPVLVRPHTALQLVFGASAQQTEGVIA